MYVLLLKKWTHPGQTDPIQLKEQISQELQADYTTILLASWNSGNLSAPFTWAYDSQAITLLNTAAYSQL